MRVKDPGDKAILQEATLQQQQNHPMAGMQTVLRIISVNHS